VSCVPNVVRTCIWIVFSLLHLRYSLEFIYLSVLCQDNPETLTTFGTQDTEQTIK
jgi:hypothetical protein